MPSRSTLSLSLLVAAMFCGSRGQSAPPGPAAAEPARVTVTVVTILATSKNNKVDPKLTCIAREVQKKDRTLTGFRIGPNTSKSMPLGEAETFPLVEDQEAAVTVTRCTENPDRFCLKIKSPTLVGYIVYSSVCGKYMPIDTGYVTKKKQDRVFLAIMVESCQGKKK
jgi:hypothetical protein